MSPVRLHSSKAAEADMRWLQNSARTLRGTVQTRWGQELARRTREAVLLGRYGGKVSHRQLV